MRARLFCPVGKLAGMNMEFENELTVGRKSTSPQSFVLSDSRISTEHARIRRDPDENCYLLEDLGSTNGTTLAGIEVTFPRRVENLDIINFGGVSDFVFQLIRETPAAPTRPDSGAAPSTDVEGGTIIDRAAPRLPSKLRKDNPEKN